jgi:hypothetical protein
MRLRLPRAEPIDSGEEPAPPEPVAAGPPGAAPPGAI